MDTTIAGLHCKYTIFGVFAGGTDQASADSALGCNRLRSGSLARRFANVIGQSTAPRLDLDSVIPRLLWSAGGI